MLHKNGKGRFAPEVSDALQLEIARIRNEIQRKIFFLDRMNQFILLVPDTSNVSEYVFADILGVWISGCGRKWETDSIGLP